MICKNCNKKYVPGMDKCPNCNELIDYENYTNDDFYNCYFKGQVLLNRPINISNIIYGPFNFIYPKMYLTALLFIIIELVILVSAVMFHNNNIFYVLILERIFVALIYNTLVKRKINKLIIVETTKKDLAIKIYNKKTTNQFLSVTITVLSYTIYTMTIFLSTYIIYLLNINEHIGNLYFEPNNLKKVDEYNYIYEDFDEKCELHITINDKYTDIDYNNPKMINNHKWNINENENITTYTTTYKNKTYQLVFNTIYRRDGYKCSDSKRVMEVSLKLR